MSDAQAATWRKRAAIGLGPRGLVHGGRCRAGPWTVGMVYGGPRPPFPLLPSAHGALGACGFRWGHGGSLSLSHGGTLTGGELTCSRAMVAWWVSSDEFTVAAN